MSHVANAYVAPLTHDPSGQKLTKGEKLVLMVLAEAHREEQGDAEISLKRLAQLGLATVSGVVRMLKRLEHCGCLRTVKRDSDRLGFESNRYTFPTLQVTTIRTPPTVLRSVGASDASTVATDAGSVGATDLAAGTVCAPNSEENQEREERKKEGFYVGLAPDPTCDLWEVSEGILEFLNRKTGKHYQPRRPNRDPTASLKAVKGLLQVGYTEQQLRQVIGNRLVKWGHDPKMQEFLRPATLFRPSKFEQYLGELGVA